ncbi:MAG TPA: choice-of-anchor tandem repeat NxxGxxAF-containing protein [Candidatus Angelobacter sp.]|nr:choice-of-anchor tandem repeat NxxGxxAF-containing protein [Candidatus Angelobacter sp.]
MLNLPAVNARPAVGRVTSLAAVFLLVVSACQAFAQTHIKFVNVADSTQGLSQFSQFPAINNRGAVAFVATQSDNTQDVFKWDDRGLRTIASTTDARFSLFTDDVVINASGVVGFRAILTSRLRAAGIFTSDGLDLKTIANSTDQGLSGPSIGAPSINASGTVAFQASRSGLTSTIIFTGDGGPLTTVLDVLNSNFRSFGAVAINRAGQIVFGALQKDRSAGIFVVTPKSDEMGKDGGSSGSANLIDIVDTHNPDFFQFGDPVINDAGIVADFAGVAAGVEVFSGDAKGITVRTDPTNGLFADFEHPSINNRGAVAFSTFETNGGQGIFVELTGGAAPVAVLQTGDTLFGSTVTGVNVGRFAFNDHFRLAFEYELEDGRSGIAIAHLQVDQEDQGETEN